MKCRFLTSEKRMLPRFVPIPMELLEQKLGGTALIVYGVLLNRALLSQKNRWIEDGKIYIIYPIRDIAQDIGKGETAVKRSLKKLEDMGLIVRKRIDFAKPNHIFVKVPETDLKEGSKADCMKVQKAPPNNTNTNIHYLNKYSCAEGESF